MALEQKNAEVFFQCLYARADAGLADTKSVCGMAKAQIFCNRQRLKQRRHGNATAEEQRGLP